MRQIAINSGEDGSVVVRKILDKEQYNYGFDAQNGEYGNLMTKGIIDPTKVVRAALQGAASVAGFVVVGSTVEEARAKRAKLDSLVDYANAIASLSITLGHDASKFDPDAPLPDNIPESNASKSGRQRAIDLARQENLTVRQLAQRLGGYSGLAMVGTSKTIADEEWLFTEGSDCFTVMFPYLPGGLDDFVGYVIPEFRRDYEGTTLDDTRRGRLVMRSSPCSSPGEARYTRW